MPGSPPAPSPCSQGGDRRAHPAQCLDKVGVGLSHAEPSHQCRSCATPLPTQRRDGNRLDPGSPGSTPRNASCEGWEREGPEGEVSAETHSNRERRSDFATPSWCWESPWTASQAPRLRPSSQKLKAKGTERHHRGAQQCSWIALQDTPAAAWGHTVGTRRIQ